MYINNKLYSLAMQTQHVIGRTLYCESWRYELPPLPCTRSFPYKSCSIFASLYVMVMFVLMLVLVLFFLCFFLPPFSFSPWQCVCAVEGVVG